MKGTGLLAVFGIVLTATAAQAVEWDKVTFRGFVKYTHKSFIDEHRRGIDDTNNEIRAQLELTVDPTESLRIRLTPEAYRDASRNDSLKYRLYFNEAYGQMTKGDFEFRAGKQVVTWGQADTIRPTDIWRRRDYSDFFKDTEEGILGLRADYTGLGNVTIQGVFVPYFVPDIFPFGEKSNRFFHAENVYGGIMSGVEDDPLTPFDERAAMQSLLDQSQGFRVNDGPNLPDSLRRSEGGVRISGSSDGWDWAVSYATFFTRVPTSFTVIPPYTANPPPAPPYNPPLPANPLFDNPYVDMTLRYERLHMWGVDFVKLFGKLGIRTEAAYFLTEDRKGTNPNIDDPYIKVTTGFDYEFTNIIGDSDLTVIAQIAIDEELPRKGTTINQKEGVNLIHFYRYAAVGTATWKFTEYFKVECPYLVNVQNGDYLVQPETTWSPVDGMELSLAGDIVGGNKNKTSSFFKVFDRDDRIRGAVKYSW